MNETLNYILSNKHTTMPQLREHLGITKSVLSVRITRLRNQGKIFTKLNSGVIHIFADKSDCDNMPNHEDLVKDSISSKYQTIRDIASCASVSYSCARDVLLRFEASGFVKRNKKAGKFQFKKTGSFSDDRWINHKKLTHYKPAIEAVSELCARCNHPDYLAKLATLVDEKPPGCFDNNKSVDWHVTQINKTAIKRPVSTLSKIIAGGKTKIYGKKMLNMLTYKPLSFWFDNSVKDCIKAVNDYQLIDHKPTNKNMMTFLYEMTV